MNGRQARRQRDAAEFVPTDRGMLKVRELLFGERFHAGFGRNDPAYMPLTAHDQALFLFSANVTAWDKYHSAADLETFVQGAPDVEQLGPEDGSERWYNDSARLAAKWILQRLLAVPEDAGLELSFWPVMESAYPHLVSFRLSTSQREWARHAALRLFDAYRFEREIGGIS